MHLLQISPTLLIKQIALVHLVELVELMGSAQLSSIQLVFNSVPTQFCYSKLNSIGPQTSKKRLKSTSPQSPKKASDQLTDSTDEEGGSITCVGTMLGEQLYVHI